MNARIEKVKGLIANGGNWNGVVYAENYNAKNAEVGVYIDDVYYFLYNSPIAWVDSKKEDTLNELIECVPVVVIEEKEEEVSVNEVKRVINVIGFYDCNGGVQELVVSEVLYDMKDASNKSSKVVFSGDIKNISKADDEQEIKEYLENRFYVDGFSVKFNLK